MSYQQKMIYRLDPSKYPARMGKAWSDEEVAKLLKSVQKKKSLEEIAAEHERTVGGIKSHLKVVAVDYHFNNNLSYEEIQKYTGLTRDEIQDAIVKYEYKNRLKESKREAVHVEPPSPEPTLTDVIARLDNIEIKLNVLLEAQCLNFVRTISHK